MNILLVHSDYLKCQAKSKTKFAEEITDEFKKLEESIKNPLIVFCSFEQEDDKNTDDVSQKLSDEIISVNSQVHAENIVLYPFVHLLFGKKPSKPENAISILKKTKELLEGKGEKVVRAPFGWYKEFELKCKGHPLAELSREITASKDADKKKVTREDVVSGIKSKYLILEEDGNEHPLDLDSKDSVNIPILQKYPDLKKYIVSEELKKTSGAEPPSIKAMQRMEFVGYPSASDSGHFQFYPKGVFIFNMLKNWIEHFALEELNCVEIKTPLIYDWSDKEINEQASSFHQKHYRVFGADDDKEFVLRFAGDFGLFKMLKKTNISYRQLPVRVYEFSDSFRYEQSGELSGLRRLRAFTMPDIHCFCGDIMGGFEEYKTLHKAYSDFANSTGIQYCVVYRIVDEFYKKHKDQIMELVKYSKTPAFVEVLSDMKHYWAIKNEFQFIDSIDGNMQLSTVQLDVKDAATYGINYVDKDNKKKGCIITHSSIGSIERWMYAILESALKKERAMLPVWLSPTQVRLLPINDEMIEFSKEVAEQLESHGIRVDIDDRVESTSKKVLTAEQDWVPYIIVVGPKEKSIHKFQIRFRETGKQDLKSVASLVHMIEDETKGKPRMKLTLNRLLSKRPIFYG